MLLVARAAIIAGLDGTGHLRKGSPVDQFRNLFLDEFHGDGRGIENAIQSRIEQVISNDEQTGIFLGFWHVARVGLSCRISRRYEVDPIVWTKFCPSLDGEAG